jgi:hypothetical protein
VHVAGQGALAQHPGRTPYLEREALGCLDFDQLKARASARAPEIIAQGALPESSQGPDRGAACRGQRGRAHGGGDRGALLNTPAESQLSYDVRAFEKTINLTVTG